MLALQKIFDTSTRGIIAQGGPASEYNGRCNYRMVTDGGRVLKCAAGQLVPDDQYHLISYIMPNGATVEYGSIQSFGATFHAFMAILGNITSVELVRDLQRAHDDDLNMGHGRVNWDRWKDTLRVIAARHKLSVEVLDEIPVS